MDTFPKHIVKDGTKVFDDISNRFADVTYVTKIAVSLTLNPNPNMGVKL